MKAENIYIVLSIASLLVSLGTQLTSRIYHAGQMGQKIDNLEKTVLKLQKEQHKARKRERENAVRNQTRWK